MRHERRILCYTRYDEKEVNGAKEGVGVLVMERERDTTCARDGNRFLEKLRA